MSEWKTVRLGDVFDLQMGKTPERKNLDFFSTTDNKWISIADISKADKYIFETKEFISDEAVKKSGIKQIPANTVIMSFKLSIGKTAITKGPMYSNEAIMAFLPNGKYEVDNVFLYHLFSNKDWSEGSNKAVKGITLNKASLLEAKILLPSLTIQKQIAKIMDKCTEIISKNKRMLETYDTLIKSRFIEMFGDNPIESGKWKLETLGDVCSSIVRGPFGSALKKEFFVPKSEKTIKVYEQKHAIQKSSTIGSYYITQEKYEELKRFECKPGDFLMSCSGTMGEFYQLPEGCEKGIINQALCKFTLNDKLEPLFFYEWMKQSIHNLETRGSGIKNVAAVSFVKQMPMIIPSKNIQKRYTTFVQQIDKSKFAVQKSLEKAETLYKSLMQEYFG